MVRDLGELGYEESISKFFTEKVLRQSIFTFCQPLGPQNNHGEIGKCFARYGGFSIVFAVTTGNKYFGPVSTATGMIIAPSPLAPG